MFFITLTASNQIDGNNKLYVNTDDVSFFKEESGFTFIMVGSQGFCVLEKASEILQKIKEIQRGGYGS